MPPATATGRVQRVLIVSSHPLFGEGLRSLLRQRGGAFEVVGLAGTTAAAAAALGTLAPDLVIVDHDDQAVNREEFLARFVAGAGPMRLVLVSLQGGGPAVIYDRHNLAVSQVEDWINDMAAHPAPTSTPSSEAARRASLRHFVNVGVLVLVAGTAVNFFLDRIGLLPVEASAQAVTIDWLFGLHFTVISYLFALIVVFMVYSIVVFRRKPGDTADGDHFEGHTGLEIAWTILPLGIVLYFSYIGAQTLADTRRVDPTAMVVKVTASQWSWAFEYPDSGVTSTSLNLPTNRQVLLQLSSTDVIHSFWVPEFRVKQDALPGAALVKELRVTPTLIGEYMVRCAELCGRLHWSMQAPVVVMSQADFDAWIQKEAAVSADPLQRGKKWAAQFACNACHSLDGSKIVGPTWKGLYGETVTLEGGATATADDAYLRESILNPNAMIVQGYPANVMPQNFKERLSEQQLADIIEYLKSLK